MPPPPRAVNMQGGIIPAILPYWRNPGGSRLGGRRARGALILVQRIAHERGIIGFVVADAEPFAGQRRDQGFGETRIAVP
jgi:hypothetical protein